MAKNGGYGELMPKELEDAGDTLKQSLIDNGGFSIKHAGNMVNVLLLHAGMVLGKANRCLVTDAAAHLRELGEVQWQFDQKLKTSVPEKKLESVGDAYTDFIVILDRHLIEAIKDGCDCKAYIR